MGELMGLITEHDGAADGYEAVQLPPDPVITAGPAMLRRRSARPSRRAVLYLHCMSDSFVPEDLASWYTERGFHFYVADLRAGGQQERPAGGRRKGQRKGSALRACFAGLDAACGYLRKADGIDAVIIGAHGTGALAAALWCHERRESAPADALVLSSPAFGRRLRRGLDIACPVLVISASGAPDDQGGTAVRAARGSRDKKGTDAVRLGPHVTWLRIDDGPAGAASSIDDRRRFFDEMGRWLGAYMYGRVRDQLL
jgi:alpha-beta hydrolase superfamily lysophospholipase